MCTLTSPQLAKVEITIKIPHAGEINKARHMPSNDKIVATKPGGSGEVFVFDLSKFPSEPAPGAPCTPTLRLAGGHTKEGYGLSWNAINEGSVLSCSEDRTIALWNVAGPVKADIAHGSTTTIDAAAVFTGRQGVQNLGLL